ncbi:hypothetical protein CHUAL_013085 [Chamberlinius hualienensis]
MASCLYCMGTEFISIDGLIFCGQCNVQTQETPQVEDDVDYTKAGVTLKGRLEIRSAATKRKGKDYGNPWTTYDAFNLILKSQTESLISLGVSSELRPTVLKLWLTYLHKTRLLYVNNSNYPVRLQSNVKKRDLCILFGNGTKIPSYRKKSNAEKKRGRNDTVNNLKTVPKRKKLKLSDLENFQSQVAPAESEAETEIVTNDMLKERAVVSAKFLARLKGKRAERDISYMTLARTIAFVYLGLLLLKEQILVCDIIRWTWEGLIPYYNVSVDVLPSNMVFQTYDINTFRAVYPLSNEVIRKETGHLASYLGITELSSLPLQYISARFIKELDLPSVMHKYVNNLINIRPPKLHWKYDERKKLIPHIPNYECRAVAFIIVALKLLFGLNDVDEWKISNYLYQCKKSNLIDNKVPFVWRDWIKILHARHEIQQLTWQRAIRLVSGLIFKQNMAFQITANKWKPYF